MDQASDAGMTGASSTKEVHDAATVNKGGINSSNSSSNKSNDHKNTKSGGKTYSNQNEEDESVYNSEDFDDHSTLDRESEDDGELDYGDDDDDGIYSQYSESATTERGSSVEIHAATGAASQTATSGVVSRPAEEIEAGMTASTPEPEEADDAGEKIQPSISTYADDFVDDDDSAAAAVPQPTKRLETPNGSGDHLFSTEDAYSALAFSRPQERGDGEAPPTGNQREMDVHDDEVNLTENGTAAGVPVEKTNISEVRLASSGENSNLGGRDVTDVDHIFGNAGRGRDASTAEVDMLRSQVNAARAMLLSSFDDDDSKNANNPEKSLLELILLAEARGYEQAERTNASKGFTEVTSKRRSSTTARVAAVGATAPLTNTEVEVEARIALERRVESLERDLARAGQESRAQSGRASSLQRKLNAVTAAGLVGDRGEAGGVSRGVRPGVDTDDVLALKAKAIQLVERLRQEKTTRLVAERETQGVATKVRVLSDHIEKLMLFLKHEATQKAKAHDQQRRLQKELELVKARSSALLRSNQAKDRVMTELREGSKILEDQLRLMDEKYMELRAKLDWTRQKAGKDVRRARAQASALRTKWALLCGEGGGGENSLLDAMPVKVLSTLAHSASTPGVATAGHSARGGGGAGEGLNHNYRRSQQQHQQHQQQRYGGARGRGGEEPGTPSAKGGTQAWATGRRGKLLGGSEAGLGPSQSDPAILARQQQQRRVISSAGNNNNVGRGTTSPGGGVDFGPGLSAGSDPGGGGVMGALSGKGGGGPRPPWSEQGGGSVSKGGGAGGHSPLLYA